MKEKLELNINKETLQEVDAIVKDLGITLEDAINIYFYFKTVIRENGIPFKVQVAQLRDNYYSKVTKPKYGLNRYEIYSTKVKCISKAGCGSTLLTDIKEENETYKIASTSSSRLLRRIVLEKLREQDEELVKLNEGDLVNIYFWIDREETALNDGKITPHTYLDNLNLLEE